MSESGEDESGPSGPGTTGGAAALSEEVIREIAGRVAEQLAQTTTRANPPTAEEGHVPGEWEGNVGRVNC